MKYKGDSRHNPDCIRVIDAIDTVSKGNATPVCIPDIAVVLPDLSVHQISGHMTNLQARGLVSKCNGDAKEFFLTSKGVRQSMWRYDGFTGGRMFELESIWGWLVIFPSGNTAEALGTWTVIPQGTDCYGRRYAKLLGILPDEEPRTLVNDGIKRQGYDWVSYRRRKNHDTKATS